MRKIEIGQRVICTESGVIGRIIKFYTPTSCEEQTMVATEDGRRYHAPTRTWIEYKDGLKAGPVMYNEIESIKIDDKNILTIIDKLGLTLEEYFGCSGTLLNMRGLNDKHLNPHEMYVAEFAKNHNISVAEAIEHQMCKARLEYFRATRR